MSHEFTYETVFSMLCKICILKLAIDRSPWSFIYVHYQRYNAKLNKNRPEISWKWQNNHWSCEMESLQIVYVVNIRGPSVLNSTRIYEWKVSWFKAPDVHVTLVTKFGAAISRSTLFIRKYFRVPKVYVGAKFALWFARWREIEG